MSERNTGYQFVSTDTEAVESLLISIYEKITGVSVKPASPEKLFIQFVAAVVIQERGRQEPCWRGWSITGPRRQTLRGPFASAAARFSRMTAENAHTTRIAEMVPTSLI